VSSNLSITRSPDHSIKNAISHFNVADFAVAVERVLDARLRGRPVIIAPAGAARAHVYDMSDEAYRSGVRKGMLLDRARAFCRDAPVLPPRPERYAQAMRAFLAQARPYSPLIELVDEGGHLFVDLTGTGRLWGPPMDVAWRIRKQTRHDLGFDPIWAIAANKLVAKVATRLVKPAGEYIVDEGDEEEFLRPLPLHLLPGLEGNELQLLREFHLRRVGEIQQLNMTQLEIALGEAPRARLLYELSRGVDHSPVLPVDAVPPKVMYECDFGVQSAYQNSQSAIRNPPLPPPSSILTPLLADTNDIAAIERALYELVEQAGAELRTRRLAARRVGMHVTYSDGRSVIRSAAVDPATANDLRLFEPVRLALARAWTRRVRVRHLRLVCDRLTFPPAQLELFPEDAIARAKQDGLIAALDDIRGKYGTGAIRFGRMVGQAACPEQRRRVQPDPLSGRPTAPKTPLVTQRTSALRVSLKG
jgi:DNA polymerase IV